jgi:hypothetical protein
MGLSCGLTLASPVIRHDKTKTGVSVFTSTGSEQTSRVLCPPSWSDTAFVVSCRWPARQNHRMFCRVASRRVKWIHLKLLRINMPSERAGVAVVVRFAVAVYHHDTFSSALNYCRLKPSDLIDPFRYKHILTVCLFVSYTLCLCILGAFAELQKATISCIMSRPSVSPHGTTRLPLDGFSWNLIFEDLYIEKTQVPLKLGKDIRNLTWRPIDFF